MEDSYYLISRLTIKQQELRVWYWQTHRYIDKRNESMHMLKFIDCTSSQKKVNFTACKLYLDKKKEKRKKSWTTANLVKRENKRVKQLGVTEN